MSSRTDRRNWVWLPSRLRFRVLGLIDVAALWVVVSALVGAGAWWGLDAYRDNRDYCTENQELRRVTSDAGEECIGVTAAAYAFDPDLADVMGRIEAENEAAREGARKSGKPVVSVAVVMPYTSSTPGAAMSKELIRHSLQGAYLAQRGHNHGPATRDTAIQLLFANVGEDLSHWRTVTDELSSRRGGSAPSWPPSACPTATPPRSTPCGGDLGTTASRPSARCSAPATWNTLFSSRSRPPPTSSSTPSNAM